MAIKVNGEVVISDTREFENIVESDVTTDATINNAIKNQGNALRIYASDGGLVRTLYCAADTPVSA